jgi:glutamate-1-semialdehyde 2,1-aminomutase
MAAGLATLDLIEAPGFHAALAGKTEALCSGLESLARKAGVAFTTNHVCGMFGLFFNAERVDSFAAAKRSDVAMFRRFFHAMLERGVYLAPSAFEAGFVSSAHMDADLDATLAAAEVAFAVAARG